MQIAAGRLKLVLLFQRKAPMVRRLSLAEQRRRSILIRPKVR